ncbi:MAG: ABC transporter ATP-binding protein [Geminicoccaceae bacterium]
MSNAFASLFAKFERLIDPFGEWPVERPPETLLAFYWHFIRQVWPFFVALLVIGLFGALIEVSLFAFLGEIVDLVRNASSPESFFETHGGTLLWMGFVALIARPVVFLIHDLLIHQTLTPTFVNRIRWQTHRYVLRQSMSFFQNDFAGRITTKVVQTAGSLRESAVQTTDAVWFMTIYITSAVVLFTAADPRLAWPLLIWLVVFAATLIYFVPRIKERSRIMSEARSMLTGRVVDSYTNILTVKLFAHAEREDDYARFAISDHTEKFQDQLRLITVMKAILYTINGALIAGTGAMALWLWSVGAITVGAFALAAGLILRINNMSGWIMWTVTAIFEHIGIVQDGIQTISQSNDVIDIPNAPALRVARGEIGYENIRFHYGKDKGVIEDLSLTIRPGEKVGLVGPSGAGKSTLVNLLLRFHDLEGGRILIDGQDISQVDQESLRAHIGMVTQDTSLLHRSVMANIVYGRPDVGKEEAFEAAERAQAAQFIPELVDLRGREGYAAHVGERGVKLSGGQRQRVAIARVLLKDAPILILDEATSALDSEVEAAIQEQLVDLMAGKTVIAIAHRLSTIAAMDRLVIMDAGRIVEEGSHDDLIAKDGLYARLWSRQSGGFLLSEPAMAPVGFGGGLPENDERTKPLATRPRVLVDRSSDERP